MLRFFSPIIENSTGKDALCTAWEVLNDILDNNIKMNKQQYGILGKLCQQVKSYGDLTLKQQFCYILYFARAKSVNTDNFRFCVELEKYFRAICEPLFNSESSFNNIDLKFLNDLEPNDKTIRVQR